MVILVLQLIVMHWEGFSNIEVCMIGVLTHFHEIIIGLVLSLMNLLLLLLALTLLLSSVITLFAFVFLAILLFLWAIEFLDGFQELLLVNLPILGFTELEGLLIDSLARNLLLTLVVVCL